MPQGGCDVTETKRWWQSKTIWGIVLAAVVAVAAQFGVTPVDDMPDWLTTGLELLGLAIALYGRLVASRKIA